MARSSIYLALLVGLIQIADAGGVKRTPKRHVMEEGERRTAPASRRGTVPIAAGGIEWTLVDTMQNAYSMLSNRVDPLTYDPVSGYVGIIHRGHTSYASGSGELWYNTSPDGSPGSWSRISALNGGAPPTSRYPSAWIASGAGAGSELFAYSAPLLPGPGYFGHIIYGVDILNAGRPFALEDPGDGSYLSNNTRITAADDSPYIWWATRLDPTTTTHASLLHLWRTMDYGTIDQFDPWPLSLFTTPAAGFDVGLVYRNGSLYAGGAAFFPGDPGEVLNLFYTRSDDNGNTWTAPEGPFLGVGDWRDLPEIASSPYDEWEEHLSFDMQVDYHGRVHFLGVIEDMDDPSADLAVVEIREGPSGWEADFVADNLAASTRTDYNGVDQMGYHVGSAMHVGGDFMAAAWLSAPSAGDSLPDIWMSYRWPCCGSWTSPENISQTPNDAEILLNVAPILDYDGFDLFTVFLARAYEQGKMTYPPDDLAPTDIYVSAYTHQTIIPSVGEDSEKASIFHLAQNYPNPFNAQTAFRFHLPAGQAGIADYGSVLLQIVDLLGREVATVVDEELAPGSYTRSWDAAGVASGVYFYRLQAGSYMETKRLVLLK